MADEQKLQNLKQEIARAVELLQEKHDGANTGEAKRLLNNAKEAITKNEFGQASDLAKRAQLAARPTTEYLLSRAKSLENDGNQVYKEGDLSKAIELWQESLKEYNRVQELASKRDEKDIVEAIISTITSIDEDIKTAIIQQANKAVDEAKVKFEARDFEHARGQFELARELYAKGAAMAQKLGSEDEARLREMDAEMASSIEACLLGKGELLLEETSGEKGEKKEAACLKLIEFLESFSSDSQDYEELKTRSYEGVAAGRMGVGINLMEDAERLLNQKEYYQAKEGYRKAQEYLENLRDFSVEHRLDREKGEVDNLIDDCAVNIKACTDFMLKRNRVAEGEIRKVEDLRKGIRLSPRAGGYSDERIEKLKTEYEIERHLGGGGFGDVYLVRTSEGIRVAIKVLRELDEHGEKVFFQELRIWEKLTHRSIVKLIRPRITPLPLFEMEYIEGGDLGRLLQNTRVLPPDRACRIAFDIVRGLQYAHSSHNVIHTDLKPRNILLTNLEEAKISDWGLGKVATSSSSIKGYTTAYAAPEQLAKKKAEEKTDVYQLGVMFYEMLTGQNPFASGSTLDIEEKVLSFVPEKPSICAGNSRLEPLDDIVSRCLEKDLKDRLSLQQFKEAIYRYMKESHGESLHLTKKASSQMDVLCRMALLEAKNSDYAGLLSCLEQLKPLIRDGQGRQRVQNLVEEMAFRKKQGMEFGDEAIDDLNNVLLTWVEYGRS